MNCQYCNTEIYPTYNRKPDGFMQMKYSCSCGKAEPKNEAFCLIDITGNTSLDSLDSAWSDPDDWSGMDMKRPGIQIIPLPTDAPKYRRDGDTMTISYPLKANKP